MKILALGTTSFLESCILGFIEAGCTIQGIISLPADQLPDNSMDMKSLAEKIGCEYFETEDINSEKSVNYIKKSAPDLIFSGWPKLISNEVLAIPLQGIIGTHPTALPLNRGRHPLQWQIVLGFKESKESFFRMEAGVDSGDLILQVPYEIKPDDTILTLSDRINEVAFYGSRTIGKELMASKNMKAGKQDHSRSNTWRKRDRHDVLIDFRMNADKILALIRSFTLPYPC